MLNNSLCRTIFLLHSLEINPLKFYEMIFEFFLSQTGTTKNIHLNLTDKLQNKTYTFRTQLRISEDNWDKERQRPVNIYLKKHKKLNVKLDYIKKELAEYIRKRRSEKKQLCQRLLIREINAVCNGKHLNLPKTLCYTT